MKPDRSGPGRLALQERKRFLDTLAVGVVAAMFVAAGVPWFFQILEIDIASAARSAFVLSAVYLALALVIDRWGSSRLISMAMLVSPFAAVAMAAVVWHLVGGVRNPTLLVLFAIPVIAAALLPSPRIVPAVAAAASICVAWTAIVESPSLGWYLDRIGLPVSVLLRRLPVSSPDAQLLEIAPSHLLSVLVGFTLAMFTLAMLLSRSMRFLRLDLERSSGPVGGKDKVLVEQAWRAGPVPTAVITDQTAQLVDGSDSFYHQMLMQTGTGRGSELFDLIQFEDPDPVRKLLASGGVLQFVRYRIGEEPRVAAVHAETFVHHDAVYCCVTIRDWNEIAYLALAADTIEHPLVLVGEEDQRLRYANRAAAAAFDEMYFGRDMRWLTGHDAAHPGFEITQIPLRLAGSEPAVLLAFTPRGSV